MADRAKSHMGGKKSKPSGKKPHGMTIHRGKSGGFVVQHHHKHGPGEMAEQEDPHVVSDMDQLHQHMDDNMGDQGPAPVAAPPQGAAPAGPAAPAPVAGM